MREKLEELLSMTDRTYLLSADVKDFLARVDASMTKQEPRIKMTQQTYSHERYSALIAQTISRIESLSKLKGGEYSGDTDRLANFRRNGARLGLPMETIWAVYAAKHWDAITQYVQDLQVGVQRERGELIAGRLDDLIVYCVLFKAMLEEREGLPSPTPSRNPPPYFKEGKFYKTREGKIVGPVMLQRFSAAWPIFIKAHGNLDAAGRFNGGGADSPYDLVEEAE